MSDDPCSHAIKDHEIAELVNRLTQEVGSRWSDAPQSLRQIISSCVVGYFKGKTPTDQSEW